MSKKGKLLKKITPYSYPSRLHERTQYPPAFRDYRKYKQHLLTEFSKQCVYCRKVVLPGEEMNFCVEHYRPKSNPSFKHLECKYENLYLSCNVCNILKSKYWAEVVDKRIINPCDDVMSHHVKFNGHSIESRSKRGELNITILNLNRNDRVNYRETLAIALEGALAILLDPNRRLKTEKKEELIRSLANFTVLNKEKLKALIS